MALRSPGRLRQSGPLHLPEGTKLWRWDIIEQRFREPRTTIGDSLRLLYPGKPYHVDLFFESGYGPAPWVRYFFLGATPSGYETGASRVGRSEVFGNRPSAAEVIRGHFYGWKADIIAPFTRTELGFDVTDEVLDVIVQPDRSYAIKDADQMEQFVTRGIYTQTEANRLHAAVNEVVDLIEHRRPPFDDTWTNWRPTPDLREPQAPEGWHLLPLPNSDWGAIHRRSNPERYT